MERWEYECAIDNARATIDAIERDRDDLWSLEHEIFCGKDDFLRQLGYRRERIARIEKAAECGLARYASLRVGADHGRSFEDVVVQDLESARQCVLRRIGELNERIWVEQSCISSNEAVLANWQD